MPWGRRYVSEYEFDSTVRKINERIDEMEASEQAQVDALTAQIGTVATDLANAGSKIQMEIDALSAANPTVDLTALQAAVAPLDASVQALGALAPTPPATPA